LWAGWLLLSTLVLFGAAKYWNADMTGLLPFANPAVIVASAALLALIAIAISKRDPISFGLLWSGFTLSVGAFHAAKISLYLLASALVLGVSFIERSYWIAYYDELTGIRGRRALNEAFETLESGYCLAVVDVDHFKSFNDTFGHDTGDQVLRKVAGQLARVGGGGEAYRCGGEEFVIVFRNRSAADAMKSAEKVREAIEQDVFHVRGADRSNREREERRRFHKSNPRRKHKAVTVTVSIGLAEAPEGFSAQQVYKAADRALYRAKDSGRNRVELARRAASPSAVAAQV
jgi:diguanylate cyclase (GGDEF)-like protein